MKKQFDSFMELTPEEAIVSHVEEIIQTLMEDCECNQLRRIDKSPNLLDPEDTARFQQLAEKAEVSWKNFQKKHKGESIFVKEN